MAQKFEDEDIDVEVACKTGYLSKKSRTKTGRLSNWRKRYFVLTRTSLKYFKDEDEASSGGMAKAIVYLQQRTKISEVAQRENCFQIKSPGVKPLTLQCKDEASMFEWVKMIREVCAKAPPRPIKVVLVGDYGDGKEELLKEFFIECNQEELVQKVKWEDNITIDLEVTGERVKVSFTMVDSRGLASLRALNYIGANAFMLCFSSSDKKTFQSVESIWHPEVHNDHIPSFLVGIQTKTGTMVDRFNAEALGEYLDAEGYFDVQLSTDKGTAQDMDEDAFVVTPAETFLSVLETTLDYMHDSETIESENDIANLDDFRRDGLPFVDAVKQQAAGLWKFVSDRKANFPKLPTSINRVFSNNAEGSSELLINNAATVTKGDDMISTTSSTEKKISNPFAVLAAMRKVIIRKKPKVDERQRLGSAEAAKTHFLNRNQTASLTFIGFDIDDDSEVETQDGEDDKVYAVKPQRL